MTGRILIVDGIATNRMVLKAMLCGAFYDALTACDAASCLGLAHEATPDLVLLDWSLPGQASLALLRELRSVRATSTLPIIVTMSDADLKNRLDALGAGADEVLQKPLDEKLLMARLRSLLRAQEETEEARAREATLGVLGMAESLEMYCCPGLVAVVGAHPGPVTNWVEPLLRKLKDRVVAQSMDDALSEPREPWGQSPDLYLIETGPGFTNVGLRLLSDLKSRKASRNAAMCLILPDADSGMTETAYDLGAQDIVMSSVEPAELAVRIENLLRRKRLGDRIRASVQDGMRLAVTDPLTGLFNRRYGLAQLDKMLEAASQGGTPLAVMVIDLDRFKSVNDGFGHAAGDAVLVEVARRLSAELRSNDLLARIGGEEFLVALPDTDLAEGQRMAARLCNSVQRGPISVGAASQVAITASIGLTLNEASTATNRERTAMVVGRADHALLGAKASGRNQVTVARNAA